MTFIHVLTVIVNYALVTLNRRAISLLFGLVCPDLIYFDQDSKSPLLPEYFTTRYWYFRKFSRLGFRQIVGSYIPVHSLIFTVILAIFIYHGTDNEEPSSESSLQVDHVF